MIPAQGLDCAPAAAVELLRMEGEIGTVEPSKCADLVALDLDTLADISALRGVRMVIKGGWAI